jgi:hypothetical protein
MVDLMMATLVKVGWEIIDHPPYNPDVTPNTFIIGRTP